MADIVMITAKLDGATERKLRLVAADKGVSRSEVVRLAILDYLRSFIEIAAVQSLPHPPDAEPISKFYIRES